MGLIGKLRTAEAQGREAARQGFTRALTSLEETQSRIRRRMRIHPRSAKPLPVFASVPEKKEFAAPPPPIVSVNGEDRPSEDLPSEEAKTEEEQVA